MNRDWSESRIDFSDTDNLNRLDAINDDTSGSPGDTLASYTYLGLGQMVIEDLEEPKVRLDYFGGTSGAYAGFDRFNRVIDQRWYDYGASEDRDRFKYGYDRASNRTWKENVVSKNLGTPVYLDEFYTYDGMHRLKPFDRGELNIPHSAIPNPQSSEAWTLDPLGNWSNYIQKTSGTTDLDQQRAVNKANEITDITETTGTSWATPAYDGSGDMTVAPNTNDLANSLDCTWDAWHRLVKVEDGATAVATYIYDSLNRRTTKTVGSSIRHFLYSTAWQVLEERLDTAAVPERQFLWGPVYIDQLILRDRHTNSLPYAVLDERIYAVQDADWNVVCVSDAAGNTLERFLYDTYGCSTVANPNFDTVATSDIAWEPKFKGQFQEFETGFYSFRMRLQHPNLGCFLSRDPAGFYLGPPGGFGLAQFLGSNPVGAVDPLGLQAVRPAPTYRPAPVRPTLRPYNPANLRRPSSTRPSLVPGPYADCDSTTPNTDNPYTLGPYTGYWQMEHNRFVNEMYAKQRATKADVAAFRKALSDARERGVAEEDIRRYAGDIIDHLAHGSMGAVGSSSPLARISVATRRLRVAPTLREKCEYLHAAYKSAQEMFGEKSCAAACNCPELQRAIYYLMAEIALREHYMRADCDSIQWGDGPNQADHPGALEQRRNALSNCFERHARRLGCELKDITP